MRRDRAITAAIGTAIADALATIAPVDCAGCGRPDRALCDNCITEITPSVTPRSLDADLTVFTALRYEGVTRQVVLALKESGRTDVARHLARSLAPAIERVASDGAEVVAVPTSKTAWRRRGYDPVTLLARRAGFPPSRVLVSHHRSTAQKSLGVQDRALNLHETMSAKGSLDGRRFVLVDDVLTSGATLVEAARALRAAGGEVVGAATLAFTPRLFGASPGASGSLR